MNPENHESLITKYRPREWDEVVGQPAVITSLKQTIEKETARSFLFCGPSGTGKTTLARLVAAKLGCEEVNVSEVDAATHTGIDAMRSLVDMTQFRPLTGTPKRAVIIDECHALSAAAWKSLLKSVEEPPEDLYWFFCTTDPEKVPNTIKTRCALYALKSVGMDDLLDLIEAVADFEKYKLSAKIFTLVAREAAGSPRQALANLAICAGCADETEAAELLQTVKGDKEVIDLCRVLVKGNLSWTDVQKYLVAFVGKDAESIRITIAAYLSSMLRSCKGDDSAMQLLGLLDCFSTPWVYDRTQQTSLCLALGRCVYSGGEEDE